MKNKVIVIILNLLLCFLSISCSKEINYDKLYEVDHLLVADPCVYVEGDTLYMYGTSAENGIVVYKSVDLINWTHRCGRAKDSLALHKDDAIGKRYFWAPQVYYIDGKYIMTYTGDRSICYAESQSPLGPFKQQTDGPYSNDATLDSYIYCDDDNKKYIYWSHYNQSNGNQHLRGAELSKDNMSIKKGTEVDLLFVEDGSWEDDFPFPILEGPCLIKHKGVYYLTYSANGFDSPSYGVGLATSDKPLGPFTRYKNNPILFRHGGFLGTGHHSFFEFKGEMYIIYHAYYDNSVILPRRTLISPISFKWDKENDIYIIQVKEKVIIPKHKN